MSLIKDSKWIVAIDQKIHAYFVLFSDKSEAEKYYQYQKELELGAEKSHSEETLPRKIVLAQIMRMSYTDKIEVVLS